MATPETRQLLLEINSSELIKEYMKEVCDDLYSIIHTMSLNICCHGVSSHQRTQAPGKAGAKRTYKYHQNMHFLMNLATTQNCTHPGSVRNCDVWSVFSNGNIRERCALLMNMLCHDKKYCIMQWIFRHTASDAACMCGGAVDCTNVTHKNILARQGWKEDTWNVALSCLNHSQVHTYKEAVGLTHVVDISELNEPSEQTFKKDIRKILCKLVHCSRKNTRLTRPLSLQQMSALSVKNTVPGLSWRETALINETRGRAPVLLFPKNCMENSPDVHANTPNIALSARNMPLQPLSLSFAEACGSDTWKKTLPSTGFDYSQILRHASSNKIPNTAHMCAIINSGADSKHHKRHMHTATPEASRFPDYESQNCINILPWLTGRMCWVMIENSSFLLHAGKRQQQVISGPSGHTHALLTFMRIFRNFDIKKWTLVCMVWLVGADHHSVYEVLVAAARHGLPFDPESNSLDFARALLRSIHAKHKKSAWGPVAVIDRTAATVDTRL